MNVEQQTLAPRAKFLKNFYKLPHPVELTYGISPGNKRQRGDALKAFIDLVNLNKLHIVRVEIMLTGYLHRHYDSLSEVQEYDDDFVREATSLLQQLEVPWEFVYWKTFCETSDFEASRKQLDLIVEADASLSTKLKDVVATHRNKGSQDKVEEYLREEATWFLFRKAKDGKKTYLTYPADTLNAVCTHLMERYENEVGVLFVPYALVGSKKVKKHSQSSTFLQHDVTGEDVIASCAHTALLMQRFGLVSAEQKTQFFAKYIEKTEQFVREQTPPLEQASGQLGLAAAPLKK